MKYQLFSTHEKINFNSEEVLTPIFEKSLGFHLNSDEDFIKNFKKDFIELKQKGQRHKDSILGIKFKELSRLRHSIVFYEKDRPRHFKKYAIELFSWARHYAFCDPLLISYFDRFLNIAENSSLPQRSRGEANDLIKLFLSKIPANMNIKKTTPINSLKLKIEYDECMVNMKKIFKRGNKPGNKVLLEKFFPQLSPLEINQVSSADNIRSFIGSALKFKYKIKAEVESILQKIDKGSHRLKVHQRLDKDFLPLVEPSIQKI